ncbi:MAG: hypothetical protein LC800_23190 [Acidobacteria bacterium]|nr:hypothetical protein [Acidobacteriota bacterium]
MNVKAISASSNRGILLDVVVFALNVILMRRLTESFIDLVGLASSGDTFAGFALGLFFLGMFVLPAAGAVLKRWHFHQRLAPPERGDFSAAHLRRARPECHPDGGGLQLL